MYCYDVCISNINLTNILSDTCYHCYRNFIVYLESWLYDILSLILWFSKTCFSIYFSFWHAVDSVGLYFNVFSSAFRMIRLFLTILFIFFTQWQISNMSAMMPSQSLLPRMQQVSYINPLTPVRESRAWRVRLYRKQRLLFSTLILLQIFSFLCCLLYALLMVIFKKK